MATSEAGHILKQSKETAPERASGDIGCGTSDGQSGEA